MNNRVPCLFFIAVLLLPAGGTPAAADLFRPGVAFSIGGYYSPEEVVIGDLNGDDVPDLATANNVPDSTLSILLGNGNGTFQPAVILDGGTNLTSIAAGDLDGDDNLDLVATNWWSGAVSVLLGNGDATFHPVQYYDAGQRLSHVTMGEFNGDGLWDLAVTVHNLGDLAVLLGNGDGSFQPAVSYEVGDGPWWVEVSDLDGDGHADLVTANRDGNDLSVLLGVGDGTFQPAVPYGSSVSPRGVIAVDTGTDGIPDLVSANTLSGPVTIRQGNGDGTFHSTADNIWDCWNPNNVLSGDPDGDGVLDLMVVDAGDDTIKVFLGNGDGTFAAADSYQAGLYPKDAAMGDLDGDGRPDLVVSNNASHDVTVLLNALDSAMLITGPGPAPGNGPLVRVFPAVQDAEHQFEFAAYGAAEYGVNVSTVDLDGDDTYAILTGAGPGAIYGPHVRGFDVAGNPITGLNFLAYGTNKYGVNVAAGDLDGDGRDEIVTGAGPGAVFGPHVRGWVYAGVSGVSPYPGVSYFAYGTPKWGVNVTCGDIDGDGYDEIVTGAGPGAVYGPHVRGWNVDGGSAAAIPAVSFLAYGTNKFGVNVSAGDVDGDGIDEILTGAGPGAVFGPHVRGWNYDGASVQSLPGFSFFAWETPPLQFGANVFAGADIDGDGRNELVAGRGPAPDADNEVKVFTYDGSAVSLWFSLDAYSGLTHGTRVAAGRL